MLRRYGSTNPTTNDTDADHGGSHELDIARCDHYSQNDDDDNPSGLTPLTGWKQQHDKQSNKKNNNMRRNNNNDNNNNDNNICNNLTSCLRRTTSLLLPILLVLTILSLYYSYQLQLQVSSLSSRLVSLSADTSTLSRNASETHHQLQNLTDTVAMHSKTISRFENSVSNSDVLEKLAALERNWTDSRKQLEGEMETTKEDIQGVLESTKKSIDETVSDAQTQINTQVQTVQSTLSTYIRTTQDQFSTENSFMIYQLAGTFTLLGCLISMWHMTSHLRSFHQPFVQRKILAILWMCPIYSVTSWLSLVIPTMEGYLGIFKDLYEAYVIYQFLSFCIAVLGKGDRGAVVALLARHADHLSPPVRCFGWCRKKRHQLSGDGDSVGGAGDGAGGAGGDDEEREQEEEEEHHKQLADDVLMQCQVFAMQFVFLRPMLTAALFVLKKMDYYGPMFGAIHFHVGNFTIGNDLVMDEDGNFEDDTSGMGSMGYRSPQFYIMILENVSVFLAFSGLLKFYHAVQEDLSWCRPFPKFLCIKGVVFMTFWQGIVLSLLADTTDILSGGAGGGYSSDDEQEKWAKQAQNFLICLEMLGFSIAHFYCFPVEEWEEGYRPVEDKKKFGDNMALGDFLHDLKLILRHNEKKKKMSKQKDTKPNSDGSISTVLEQDEELGCSESSDDGLRSLLENDDGLAKSDNNETDANEKIENNVRDDKGSTSKISSTASLTPRKSIHESLKAMDAPWELRQATALLLQSSLLDESTARLLTSDILDQPMVNNETNKEPGRKERGLVKMKEQETNEEESTQNPGESNAATACGATESSTEELGIQPQTTSTEITANDEEVPSSESSLLLPTPIKNKEMLRPSIFTMHSSHSSLEES